MLFGLSKVERPILDHHTKAHNLKSRRISYGFHPWNPADFTCEIRRISWNPWNLADFRWNPPKIIKASVSAKLQFDGMQGGGFHPWNPLDFTLKSGGFDLWNLVDFTQISPVKSTQNYKSKCFSKHSSVWWMQGGGYDQGFHEIHQISPWNLVDFTHEIWQISPVKSTQNYKSKCFSKNSSVWWMQGGGFHPWNPPDFTLKSGGFDLWNLVDFTQISPVKSTQIYKSKCFQQKLFSLMNARWGISP